MSRPRRVLVTARAACAAWSMAEIWRSLAPRGDLDLRILAQQPALDILRRDQVPSIDVGMPHTFNASSEAAGRLLDYAETAISEFDPDVVLAGLSTPGEGGIDEAVLLKARCPTFVVQDFWGDCNLFFGRHPDAYLACDAFGAELTKRRHDARAVIVGSPRHARYAGIDFEAARHTTLMAHGLDPSRHHAGIFTQPLFAFPGYVKTLEAWAAAVRNLGEGTSIIYRPHPACSHKEVQLGTTIFADHGLSPTVIAGGPTENAIVACSSMASALSNTNFDSVYVNYFAKSPKALPIYLLWERDLTDHLGRFQDLDQIPIVSWGMAHCARQRSQLEPMLKRAFDPMERRSIWESASTLPDPMHSLDLITEILSRPGQFV